jgi:hypothetical protein
MNRSDMGAMFAQPRSLAVLACLAEGGFVATCQILGAGWGPCGPGDAWGAAAFVWHVPALFLLSKTGIVDVGDWAVYLLGASQFLLLFAVVRLVVVALTSGRRTG